MKPFRLCKPYLKTQKYSLLTYVILTFSSVIISILSPYIIGDFIDTLISEASIRVIVRFCVIFGGLNVLRIMKNYITNYMNTKMQLEMSYSLNIDVIKHIQSLSLSYSSQLDSAYLSQRIGGDTNNLISFCISVFKNIITNTITIFVPFIILLTMNWFIAILMLGFLGVYMILYFAFKKHLYKAVHIYRECQAKFFAMLLDQIRYIKLIKLNSIQNEMINRADDSYYKMKRSAIHNQKIGYLYNSADGIISTVAQISLFVIGGIQVLAGNFTIGMFTIFTSYFNMMLGACRYFFSLGSAYQNTLVAHDRICEIFEQKPECNGVKIISNIEKIEFQNVVFSYTNSINTQVVQGFNKSFSKGTIYGIVGENGAGKSTLINLLVGMYVDEYEGHIFINNINIRDINMTSVRRNLIGFSEQEPQLINETIAYNLCFGETLIDNMSNHIDTLNMKDFVSKHGFDYILNEKNTNTSGGEKQKIAILKVLYKDPEVMIFDEPSSALDKSTIEKFMMYLHKIKRDKMIIIVTHDDVVKEFCDSVINIATISTNELTLSR